MSIGRCAAVVFLSAIFALEARPQVVPSPTLPAPQRIYLASRIYSAVETYFAGWTPELKEQFEEAYRRYIAEVLASDQRRDFDLASIRLLASLHNGHTGFSDSWLDRSYGSPIGFNARDYDGKWTVIASGVPGIELGDVIETIDDVPVQQFFEHARPYLADSNTREQETDLFSTAYLFPNKFSVGFTGKRSVTVDRSRQYSSARSEGVVTGRWLQDQAIGYIKIPAFDGVTCQAKALEWVHQFKHASALVIDLRGNPGGRGDPPRDLQMALMEKPYRSWIESSPTMTGRLSTMGYAQPSVSSGPMWVHPEGRSEGGVYRGQLLFLIDRECASYCEDFLMPFKTSGRGLLVGEATAGTYAQTYSLDLGDGMRALIAATAEHFPDGTEFEGVGIQPDTTISLRPDDIRAGSDLMLAKALKIVASR